MSDSSESGSPKTGASGSDNGALARQQATTALYGGNAPYVEDLYERWLGGETVPADWQRLFAEVRPAGTEPVHGALRTALAERAQLPRAASAPPNDAANEKQAAVSRLIQVYTNRGHLIAERRSARPA